MPPTRLHGSASSVKSSLSMYGTLSIKLVVFPFICLALLLTTLFTEPKKSKTFVGRCIVTYSCWPKLPHKIAKVPLSYGQAHCNHAEGIDYVEIIREPIAWNALNLRPPISEYNGSSYSQTNHVERLNFSSLYSCEGGTAREQYLAFQ